MQTALGPRVPCLGGAAMALMLALAATAAPAGADPLNVVVTSKPIHALVTDVMQGAGSPELLVDGTASPHTYAMKPSDARKVNQAHVFFRVSEALEPFTAKLVRSLPRSVSVVTLAEANGVTLLQRRAGGAFEAHAHSHGAKSGGGRHHVHTHRLGSAGGGGAYDAHIWLDPDNAKAIAYAAATALAARSPAEAERFRANAAALAARIDALAASLARDLKPVSGRPFVVLHDAYQYFEHRFGLAAIGSITVGPDEQPSARRISDLRRKVLSLSAVCVFAEPHFKPGIISSVTEGTSARTAVLDPEGTGIEPGPDLYFELMRRLAANMRSCLAAPA